MDDLNSDLLINIISSLNVKDSCRLSQTSRRMCFLVDQCRDKIFPPGLVSMGSWRGDIKGKGNGNGATRSEKHIPVEEIYANSLKKLRAPPNFAICFLTGDPKLAKILHERLPPEAPILASVSTSIQSAGLGSGVECNSENALMLGSFHRTTFFPFNLNHDDSTDAFERLSENIAAATPNDAEAATTYWKYFTIYACGHLSNIDDCITQLQGRFPEAVIVGGVCDSAYIRGMAVTREDLERKTTRQLKNILLEENPQIDLRHVLEKSELVEMILSRSKQDLQYVSDGICGVAMGGDVPVRSVVSRGSRSLTTEVEHGNELSPWHVVETTIIPNPRGHPVHSLNTVKNEHTGTTLSTLDFIQSVMSRDPYLDPTLCLMREEEERDGKGYDMHGVRPLNAESGSLLVFSDGTPGSDASYLNSRIDAISLDERAILQDMTITMRKLREETRNETILGAIMFSCSGRGPEAGRLIAKEMADATIFHEEFPELQCLGFYAGGEIGPKARFGATDIFRRGDAAVQGFTAVFALFIVPKFEGGSHFLDDDVATIERHMREKHSVA
eukprot:CAMPEP_0198286412 /NCGR_PEP_ID=MMETSP1449-20131203/5506_1 /TAXON_ID=420275 /ORGANISM="Attheya septentrionalis, Strain CCMP2084" /LENGTH=557 /DNA_ID=CAMNT_0043984145 /DNA_START=85 /DNA_END=1758 /DNA_ORIENTATION=+